ncbi:hypothetical protein BDQ17DRAFT_1433842 [Cyathus striatus]|nr:hypothetical protein BDQ17DRAFT_1433842 [Cyathus striatus]
MEPQHHDLAEYDDAEDGGIVDDNDDEFGDGEYNPEDNSEPSGSSYALAALKCLHVIIKPRRKTRYGYKDPGFDLLTRQHLEDMRTALYMYTEDKGPQITWKESSLFAAKAVGHGEYYAKQLRKWLRAFILDQTKLPENNYGAWKESMLEHEDIAQELRLHLQSVGKHVCAQDIVDYLDLPDVKARLRLKKTVSLATAQRWMILMGYRWIQASNGQFVDGHEQPDVVKHRQEVFLPVWAQLVKFANKWTDSGELIQPINKSDSNLTHVFWFHDESTFYAHDQRKTRWVHESEKAMPQPKGEGISLMVSDYVSADYGWSHLQDGKHSARVYFKASKG